MLSIKGRMHKEGGYSELILAEKSSKDLSVNYPLTKKKKKFLVAALLECNSLNIIFILLKYKYFGGKLVYSQSCATFFTNFRTFSSLQKETLYLLIVNPHCPFPAVPGDH